MTSSLLAPTTISSAPPAPAPQSAPTPVLTLVPHRPSREGAVNDLATRQLRGVSALLQARPDLRGVHAFADAVEEAVRWSA